MFESKNYSGWIFGSEAQKTWTQTLPQGRRAHKEHFLNPIIQNNLHIKWLKRLIQDEAIPVYSVIVFSERCALKNVTISSLNVEVIKRNHVYKTVSKINSNNSAVLTQNKILEIYNGLYPYSQTSMDVKQAHINNIHNRIRQDNSKNRTISDNSCVEVRVETISEGEGAMMCPRCGAPLVLRIAKKGQHAGDKFYGCSSYPKCKYTKTYNK